MVRPRTTPLRLVALVFAVALVAAACGGEEGGGGGGGGGGNGEEKEPLKLAGLFTQRVTAGDWDPAGFHAFEGLAAILGEKYEVETSIAETADYDTAPQTLRDYANQGYQIIVAHSSGYEPAVLEVAPEYPDTWFLVFSDLSSTQDLPNVAAWKVAWTHLGYLQGAVACLSTESGNFGLVNSVPIPAFTKTAGGAQKAAEDICGSQDAMLITWIDSFTDVAKAKDAALAMVAEGADVVFDAADTAGQGVFEAAKEEDFSVVGKYIDQSELAPKVITSVLIDFDAAYAEMGELYNSDQLEPKIYDVNIARDMISITTPFEHVDPTVEEEITQIIEDIKSGAIEVSPDLEVLP